MSVFSSRKRANRGISFPTRVLALSLLLTAFTVGWLSYCAISTYLGVTQSSARYVRSTELCGTIVHLDEVLTMSARMAAATGAPKWEKRYRENEATLDRAIKAAIRDNPPSAARLRALDVANLELVKMENDAFSEVRAGHADRARAILDDPFYAEQKSVYAAAINNYSALARSQHAQELQTGKRQSSGALIAAVVGFLSLCLGWSVAMRELTRWRHAQGVEIAARRQANRELEAKRAQLEDSEARYLRMAANVPGMVYQFILHGNSTISMPFISEGAREIYGIESAQIRVAPTIMMDAIIAEDRAAINASLAQSARELCPWNWEGRIDTPDGTRKWLSGASRPYLNADGDTVWDGLLIDITARKNHEADLDAALREAERANAAKSEFLSRMSHELRTPLNAILGFGQLLEVEDLTEQQSESVGQILVAGRHLLSLINEVLDIARIESGQQELQLQPLDVAPLAHQIAEMMRPLAAQNGITLDICIDARYRDADCCGTVECAPESVLADPQRFKQVLLNLLSNAIKYAGENARVEVSCAANYTNANGPQSEMLALTVRDNGPGIAPELQQRIWTPFDRIGAEASSVEGAGIGLPLARALTEAMGGTLTLQSAPGEGCAFTITLPSARAENSINFAALQAVA